MDRLNKILKSSSIAIIMDNDDNYINNIKKNHSNNIKKPNSDFSNIDTIIIKSTNPNLITFSNNHLNKKIIIIANKDFDFNTLYKESKFLSIDSIIPYNLEEYFIILNNQ